MREVNINIEGYNVNGICVGCLNYNRQMFYSNDIQECFKILADIDVPDGLSIQVCWECLAAVAAVNRFKRQITQAYDVLIKYSRKHTFLNNPEDLSQYAHQRLTVVPTKLLVNFVQLNEQPDETDQLKTEIKTEPHVLDDTKDLALKIIIEDEVKPEFQDTLSNVADTGLLEVIREASPLDSLPDTGWSDDDIQLSKLKKKKERRGRKSKKEKKRDRRESIEVKDELKIELDAIAPTMKVGRKLKNLPEDLVELYTMTEEEMWQIRSEDLASEEFLKLKYKCEDCIIGFNTEKLCEDHMNGKHKQKTADCPQCDVCKSYLLTAENLTAHRSRHRAAYRCAACGLRTALKRRMVAHSAGHRRAPAACAHCGETFASKSKLSYHKTICHQERPQCDCCGKVFANKMTLKYHLKILPQNKEDKPKEKLYIPCKGCNKVFHSKKSYRAHVVIHDGLTYPCPICGKLFQWKRNLSRHARNHRERAAGALHECRECGKTFSSRDCYNNHMRLSKRHVAYEALRPTHPPTQTISPGLERAAGALHECRECGKTFSSRDCYNNHMRLSKRHVAYEALRAGGRRGALHECRECGKTFSSRDCYNNHMRLSKRHVAYEALSHECHYCGKKFATKWCMVDHIDWDHLKKIKYQCSVCFKPFKTAKIMVAHMNNIHEGKRNREPEGEHLCEICGKSYKTVKRLKGHVWAMHTNRSTSKSFKCKLCPATFTWQTSIYKHTKMMHSTGKRNRQPSRQLPAVKKQDPYQELEAARLPYFPIGQDMTHLQQPYSINMTQ